MRGLLSITNYFTEHPMAAALKYSVAAFVGGTIFALGALFTGHLDATVIFNGFLMLFVIALTAFIRFGLYRIVSATVGLADWARGLLTLGESGYFLWMLFIAWDTSHPEYSEGAFTMMAMLAHFLVIPLGVVTLTVVGIIFGVRAIRERAHTARVTREWRERNATA